MDLQVSSRRLGEFYFVLVLQSLCSRSRASKRDTNARRKRKAKTKREREGVNRGEMMLTLALKQNEEM